MIWTLALTTAAALFALAWTVNALLFAASRDRALYRFVYLRSAWYRRWIFSRVVLPSIRRINDSFAAMVPTARRAAESMQALHKALSRAGASAPPTGLED